MSPSKAGAKAGLGERASQQHAWLSDSRPVPVEQGSWGGSRGPLSPSQQPAEGGIPKGSLLSHRRLPQPTVQQWTETPKEPETGQSQTVCSDGRSKAQRGWWCGRGHTARPVSSLWLRHVSTEAYTTSDYLMWACPLPFAKVQTEGSRQGLKQPQHQDCNKVLGVCHTLMREGTHSSWSRREGQGLHSRPSPEVSVSTYLVPDRSSQHDLEVIHKHDDHTLCDSHPALANDP